MAKCKTIIKSVQLDLSIEEAEVLVTILHRVGGNPETSKRKYTDSILSALTGRGIEDRYDGEISDKTHAIYFK